MKKVNIEELKKEVIEAVEGNEMIMKRIGRSKRGERKMEGSYKEITIQFMSNLNVLTFEQLKMIETLSKDEQTNFFSECIETILETL